MLSPQVSRSRAGNAPIFRLLPIISGSDSKVKGLIEDTTGFLWLESDARWTTCPHRLEIECYLSVAFPQPEIFNASKPPWCKELWLRKGIADDRTQSQACGYSMGSAQQVETAMTADQCQTRLPPMAVARGWGWVSVVCTPPRLPRKQCPGHIKTLLSAIITTTITIQQTVGLQWHVLMISYITE